jgi:hypothetical protein
MINDDIIMNSNLGSMEGKIMWIIYGISTAFLRRE